jgi:GT2 family glycosyltransferase
MRHKNGATSMTETDSPNVANRITVVVLTWNDTEMTSRCLESVLANEHERFRTIVVDNGSTIPVAPTIHDRFPDVEVMRLEENVGFSMGCNHGLMHGLSGGAEYILLLNNDTVLAPDVVSRLAKALQEDPQAGMASALLLYPGEGKIIQYYRGSVDRNRASHLHPEDSLPFGEAHMATVASDFAPASAVMFRSKALDQIGLFDMSIYICWEDYDLCLRLRDKSWKILTVGQAHVVHEHGQTTGRASPYITYYFTRNRLICLFRYGSRWKILTHSPRTLRSFWWQLKGLKSWAAYRAFLRGFLHACLGVRGAGVPPKNRNG